MTKSAFTNKVYSMGLHTISTKINNNTKSRQSKYLVLQIPTMVWLSLKSSFKGKHSFVELSKIELNSVCTMFDEGLDLKT